ncbi:MAG: serine protease [Dehalococcoidia bacterium]
MPREDRLNLIREIEALRGSRLLAAVWGDRPNHPTIIASDAHAIFFEHLERIGEVPKIDVLLYTAGGHTLAAWGLANLVREYCDALGVLIPHRALSAGTLFTLAANEIIMTRLGQLSPIDPSVNSALGPKVETPNQLGQAQVVPISVEDVVGFLDLARREAALKEERSLLTVFDRLSAQVHPLALGAVYRSREQIVSLADRLLAFHMDGEEHKDERDRIVSRLTRELGSHDYLIGRSEAQNALKLKVIESTPEIEAKVKALFSEYSALLELGTPYNADGFLGAEQQTVGTFPRAVIETTDLTHVFQTTKNIQRIQVQQPGLPVPTVAIQERASFEGWLPSDTL